MKTFEKFIANQIEKDKELNLYKFIDFINVKTKFSLSNSVRIEIENDIEIEELSENEIDFR